MSVSVLYDSPSRPLAGTRCLVTGGSRNLGRGIVLALAKAGAQVAFTFSKRVADADDTRRMLVDIGVEPLVFQGSVADSRHVNTTIESVVQQWGGLDVLVNNAGMTQILPIALLDEDDWDQVMNVNAKGAYLYSRAALKPMLKARSGHILNIGSFAVDRVVSGPAHYAASKAALKGFTESLAAEVGRYGIAVNYVAPGLLQAGLAKRLPQHRIADYVSQCALQRVGTFDEVAALVTWMVSSDNTLMTGAKISIDGGC
jgi:3-oxoacyl-[acyl-carrier protein] reductase